MSRPSLVIVGAGGHAASVASVALSAGYAIRCFVDAQRPREELLGASVVGELPVADRGDDHACCIAIGDNAVRARALADLVARHPGLRFPALVHASAVISTAVEIGEGTVVMPGAVIGPGTRVGRFCIVNTNASIDHDGEIADFASLAPGVVAGGRVSVGARSAISIGAVVLHAMSIGSDTVVGASSLVNRDVPANCVAYGIPARVIRSRNAGDPYLG